MNPPKVKWEEMFPDEMDRAIEERPLLYLPYGMCEPHGFQNALGLDGLKCYELCVRAAREGGGVVAPMTFWHIGEQGIGVGWLERQNAPRPYISSVGYEIFLQGFIYHLRAAVACGFEAVIAMTGHYGGTECDMRTAAGFFAEEVPLPMWVLADWECIHYGKYKGDHAGPCETSQLWALRPDLVDISRLPEKDDPDERIFASPLMPGEASRLEGDMIVASQIGNMLEGSDRLLAQSPGKLPDIGIEGARAICERAMSSDAEWVYQMEPERHTWYWSEGPGKTHRQATIASEGRMI
jgi:creatinine amidohydrolase